MLSIAAHQFEPFYSGIVKYIVVKTRDGKTLQLPAHHLKPFVSRDGIYGEFLLCYDDGNKLISIERIIAPSELSRKV